MFGLGTMFSPVAVLQVLADEIEKQLKKPVDKYIMIYSDSKKFIEFKINDDPTRLPLDMPQLGDALKTFLLPKLPKNCVILYAMVYYYRATNGTFKNCVDVHVLNNDTQEKINETIPL